MYFHKILILTPTTSMPDNQECGKEAVAKLAVAPVFQLCPDLWSAV
jgi:hypothetical protein